MLMLAIVVSKGCIELEHTDKVVNEVDLAISLAHEWWRPLVLCKRGTPRVLSLLRRYRSHVSVCELL
jgi:hypothetical protein